MYFSVVVAKLLSEEPWFGFKYLKLLVGKKGVVLVALYCYWLHT